MRAPVGSASQQPARIELASEEGGASEFEGRNREVSSSTNFGAVESHPVGAVEASESS
jgi:hypothetical protein